MDSETVCALSADPPIDGNTGTTLKANDAPLTATIVTATVVSVSADAQRSSQTLVVAPQSERISTSSVHCVVPLVAYDPPTVMPVMALSDGVSTADTIWSVNAIESTVSVIERPVITFDAAMIDAPNFS